MPMTSIIPSTKRGRPPAKLGPIGCGKPVMVRLREPLNWHCQSKFYTACSRIRAGCSSTVFAHELTPAPSDFDAKNRLYSFALTVLAPRLELYDCGGSPFPTGRADRLTCA